MYIARALTKNFSLVTPLKLVHILKKNRWKRLYLKFLKKEFPLCFINVFPFPEPTSKDTKTYLKFLKKKKYFQQAPFFTLLHYNMLKSRITENVIRLTRLIELKFNVCQERANFIQVLPNSLKCPKLQSIDQFIVLSLHFYERKRKLWK